MLAEGSKASLEKKIPVEQYNYSEHLDVAKVISETEAPDVCGVVTKQMVYEDSQGKRHILEYEVVGSGCSGG